MKAKKTINTITLGSILFASIAPFQLTSCGGKVANPVMSAQFGDEQKSCKALEFEMNTAQDEIRRLLPQTDKTGKNVALGVAGAFLLVPWFFMDFKNGEQQEYEAYRQRYNHLASIAISKRCDVKPENYPSAQEIEKKYEEEKQKKENSNKANNERR